MTFWLQVGLGYLMLLGVGTAIGALLGTRWWGRGRGRGGTAPVEPCPFGPSLALDCPPLGSAFDRALLPGVFDDEHVPA